VVIYAHAVAHARVTPTVRISGTWHCALVIMKNNSANYFSQMENILRILYELRYEPFLFKCQAESLGRPVGQARRNFLSSCMKSLSSFRVDE